MNDFDEDVRRMLEMRVRQLEAENAHLREAIDALQRAAAATKPRKRVRKRRRRLKT